MTWSTILKINIVKQLTYQNLYIQISFYILNDILRMKRPKQTTKLFKKKKKKETDNQNVVNDIILVKKDNKDKYSVVNAFFHNSVIEMSLMIILIVTRIQEIRKRDFDIKWIIFSIITKMSIKSEGKNFIF